MNFESIAKFKELHLSEREMEQNWMNQVPEGSLDHAISLLVVTKDPSYLRSFREYPAVYQKSLRVSVQGMLAALTTSALTLANWFRTRWIRVCQVVGASKRWCAHRGRRGRKKALQARLMHRKSI